MRLVFPKISILIPPQTWLFLKKNQVVFNGNFFHIDLQKSGEKPYHPPHSYSRVRYMFPNKTIKLAPNFRNPSKKPKTSTTLIFHTFPGVFTGLPTNSLPLQRLTLPYLCQVCHFLSLGVLEPRRANVHIRTQNSNRKQIMKSYMITIS